MTWKPGNIIVNKTRGLRREIVDVRRTGYGWKYPEHCGEATPSSGRNYFNSESGKDALLVWGWELESAADLNRARSSSAVLQ